MGDPIENSPYRFKMCTNESDILHCRTDHLSAQDFNLLEKQTDEVYRVNVIIDQPGGIKWPSRWDAYLNMEGAKVHWFSILNSLMVIAFLTSIALVILLRTVKRDLTQFEELDKELWKTIKVEITLAGFQSPGVLLVFSLVPHVDGYIHLPAVGSVAIYLFLYSVNSVFDFTSLNGPISATLFLGYSLFMVIAIMLAKV
ncbi:unnamed protein product [Musa acuminata subsp. burmannicoides]